MRISDWSSDVCSSDLSDSFCITRHRADFQTLIDNGEIDILFANEAEIQALNETDDFENAVNTTAAKVGTLVVTRSEKGAVAVNNGQCYRVNAAPVDRKSTRLNSSH